MGVLDERVAIVTGAGQGVGMGAAMALAAAGARVVMASRTVSKVEDLADRARREGHAALPVACDVTQADDITRCIETTLSTYGRIDSVVNAADDQRLAAYMDITEDDLMAGYRTGVLASVRFTQQCVPHMEKVGGGTIVNVASGAGMLATAGLGPYAAGKEAIRTLSRVAAVELGPRGIRVNVICPLAWAPTFEHWAEQHPEDYQRMLSVTPLGRVGDPVQDVGAAVVFLCSSQSRYITGSTLMVDGGNTYAR
jgi:NAD(P)-dependent dehydrogenase (short-subunit alcohol dehydrogenase family)